MVKIAGAQAVTAKLRQGFNPKGYDLITQALFQAGQKIETDAENSITEGASSSPHIPSRPGEAPNEETGNLRGFIQTEIIGPLKTQVASRADYAAALEFGTSKIAPRPYMAPAAEKNRKDVTAKVVRAVNLANRIK